MPDELCRNHENRLAKVEGRLDALAMDRVQRPTQPAPVDDRRAADLKLLLNIVTVLLLLLTLLQPYTCNKVIP